MNTTKLFAKFRTKIDFLNERDWIVPSNDDWEVRPNNTNYSLTAYKTGGGTYTFINGGREIFEIGKKYKITYTIIDMTEGNLYLKLSTSNGTLRTENGTYSDILEYTYASDLFINGNIAFDGGIYNIQIEEIGYSILDLSDNSEILITKSLLDVRNIQDKLGSSSKEFILPGSSTNNKFFKFIFNINQDNVYNSKVKVPVMVIQGDQNVLTGYLQLTNILVSDDMINYKCIVYGDSLDFFKAISKKSIRDLDPSDINHDYIKNNTFSSYDNKVRYPMIDWGNDISYEYLTQPRGYGSLYRGIAVDDTYACVNANWIFDQIHKEYGVNWDSDIFEDSTAFGRVVVPVNDWNHDSDWVDKKRFTDLGGGFYSDIKCNVNASLFTVDDAWFLNAGSNTITLTAPNNSTQNWFNIGGTSAVGSRYAPPEGAYVKFRLNFSGTFSGTISATNIATVKISVYDDRREDGYGSNPLIAYKTFNYNEAIPFNAQFTTDYIYVPKLKYDGTFKGIYFKVEVTTVTGSVIIDNPSWALNMTSDDVKTQIAPTSSIVNMTTLLPDISQRDYIKSLMDMFNVFVDYDFDSNTLIYRTYDTFYSTGSEHDWTYKQDIDSGIDIQLISELQNRDFEFTHNNGGEYLAEDYETANDRVYGTYNITNENEFVEGEQIVNSNSNSTLFDSIDSGYWAKPIYISRFGDEAGVKETKWDVGLRFLYYDTQFFTSSDSSYKTYKTDEYFNQYSFWYYESATHLLVPDNDITTSGEVKNYDLNYGNVNYLIDTTTYGETNNTLYNLYWKKYIENLLGKDSKMVTSYFKLEPSDIANLSLNDTLFVNGTYYYINSLIDYHPDRLTKLELIKLDSIDITFQDYISGSTSDSIITSNIGENTNSLRGHGISVGEGSSRNVVIGNNVTIGTNSFNNRIYGDNIVIGDNVSNSVIDNSNNVILGQISQYSTSLTTNTGTSYDTGVTLYNPDVQFISIKNSDSITVEKSVTYLDVKSSSDIIIKSGVSNLTVDSEVKRTISESEITLIRGTKVYDGELTTNFGGLNEPGVDQVQVPFSNGLLNDCGENNVWDLDWIDSDVIVDSGEDIV